MLNKVRPGRCRAEVLLEAPEPAGNVVRLSRVVGLWLSTNPAAFKPLSFSVFRNQRLC